MENTILGIIFVLFAMALFFLPTAFRNYVMQKCYEAQRKIAESSTGKIEIRLIQYVSLLVAFLLGGGC